MPTRDAGWQLAIDRHQQLPIYQQICERFKAAIAAGHLRAGDRVPAVRGLATELNTARGTVELAYRILADEGYLQVRGAAGTFVSASLPGAQAVAATSPNGPSPAAATYATGADLALVAYGGAPLALQPGLPALDAFPRKVWNRLVAHRLRQNDPSSLNYPAPAGYGPLRERIATYLGLSRGVECTPAQVFVTSGYRASLELVLRCLATDGDRFLFEEPGYLLARRFLTEAGAQLVPVPVDEQGMQVAHGIEIAPTAPFALVTPSHQSPFGMTLSLPRRMALLEWAAKQGSWVIEDDYDSEFRYSGRPLPALKSLDTHDRVIYCGTFSKVMFPGLRLAYVVVPMSAVARFERLAQSMNAGSPQLLQAGVTDFIAQGHFSRHLKRMRTLYAQRRQWIAQALRDAFGARLEVEMPTAGLHFVVKFVPGRNGPVDDDAVAARARADGMGVSPLSQWYAGAPTEARVSGLVLGFANVVDADEAVRLASRLRRALDG